MLVPNAAMSWPLLRRPNRLRNNLPPPNPTSAAVPKRPVSAPRAVKSPIAVPNPEPQLQKPEAPVSKPAAVISEGGCRVSEPAPVPQPTAPQPEVPTEPGSDGAKWLLYLLVGMLVVLVLIYIFTRSASQPDYMPSSPTRTSATANTTAPAPASRSQGPAADPNAFETGGTVYTFADNTWLRSSMQKGVDYNKLELLKAGEPLTALNIDGDWTRVRKQTDGTTGYVATDAPRGGRSSPCWFCGGHSRFFPRPYRSSARWRCP